MKKFIILSVLIIFYSALSIAAERPIINGDAQFAKYLPLLTNKRVAVFANSASTIDGVNIIDALESHNVAIVKIFTPEHGFSGLIDAGAAVNNSSDKNHNLKIVSLYGTKTKPEANDLKDVDIIVFDIQDVGVRFYTYISSLQKLMEAAIENNKPLIILDRANPNGFYIDGPVLIKKPKYMSFIGMQPIPIVYGMTIGEYAQMLVGERWLNLKPKSRAAKLDLTIIPVENYTHQSKYQVTSRPSPNLPNMNAIYWYPSLGWFEGTKLSIGRGTKMPFEVLGSPYFKSNFSFMPVSSLGATNPPLKDKECFGWDLRMSTKDALEELDGKIQLHFLIEAYQKYPNKTEFFTPFFTKLAGNDSLRQQIIAGKSESEIRLSWQPGLNKFKQTRAKYLIYKD